MISFFHDLRTIFAETKDPLYHKMAAWAFDQMNQNEIWEKDAFKAELRIAYSKLYESEVPEISDYRSLANRGSIWSMRELAFAVSAGVGTEPNFAEAEKWYRRAIEGGSDLAIMYLARLYSRRGALSEAEQILNLGVEKGLVPAMSALAYLLMKTDSAENRRIARNLFKQAVEKGDLWAEYHFTRMLVRGRFGISSILDGLLRFFKYIKHAERTLNGADSSETFLATAIFPKDIYF